MAEETVNNDNFVDVSNLGGDPLDSIDTTVEKIEQTQEETQEEVKEQIEEQPKEEPRESIIERLKNKVFGKSEDKKETPGDTESSGSESLEEDISDKFTQAAKQAGWSDEQIIELAEKYNNKDLEDLIPFLVEETEEVKKPESDFVQTEAHKGASKETTEEKKTSELNIEDPKIKTYLEQIEKALDAKYQEKIGKIEQGLKTTEQERSVKEAMQYQTTADEFFDGASKEFPVFGTTEQLVRFPKGSSREGQIVPKGAAFEARNAVFNTARAFHQMGSDWKDALNESMAWYKGKNLEKEVRSKVLKDLKNNEKRVSPKRGEHTINKEATTRQALIEDLSRRAGM
jgi:hypothetical protein